jgi:deoxyribonuclease-1
MIRIVLLIFFSSSLVNAGTASSWSAAKQLARDQVYSDRAVSFYCGCDYQSAGKSGGKIDKTSCGYESGAAKHQKRANQLEWEHVVPASLMPARQFSCWTTGLPKCSKPGRACCEKHDIKAREMIFDLHNLVPSVGQLNALRSNKRYSIIAGEARSLGVCDVEWNKDILEPREEIRGDVARIWLYMNDKYGLVLSGDELSMYKRWSSSDPVSDWELVRNQRIKDIQGNGNPFIVESNVEKRGLYDKVGDSKTVDAFNLKEKSLYINNPFEGNYSNQSGELEEEV